MENATVARGGDLPITIEAGAADGIRTVKLFLDRISEDEFDYTSLGVFPGTFGVGAPESREKTVTANWSIGSHKLIAVATGHSGETTTVEKTFRVGLPLPEGLLPGRLPERQRRYIPDPRQTIRPPQTRIVPPRQGRDGHSRRDPSGSTFQMRRQPTRIFPTQQARQQGNSTNARSSESRRQSSQSNLQRLQSSNRLHTLQEDKPHGLQLPVSLTRQQGNRANARSSFDRRKAQPVNGRARVKTEPGRTEFSGNSGIQGGHSSRVSAAALLQRAAPPSHNKKKSQTKVKLNQVNARESDSDKAVSSETGRESQPPR